MITAYRFVALTIAMSCTICIAETRTWTGNNGKTLEAEFVEESRGEVSLRTVQGQIISTRRSSLSPADQSYLDSLKTSATETLGARPAAISDRHQRLINKLNTIIIPQIEFRLANIADVIEFLRQQSVACDTNSAVAEKGVNLILDLRRPGDSGLLEPAAKDIPAITCSLYNMLLIDAIECVATVVGLKYRIEEDAVMITWADVVSGEIITKTYHLNPLWREILLREGGARGAESSDARDFFIEAGVPFPEGSSILYAPGSSLLTVSNTKENLERLERVLAYINNRMQVDL